jgi:hypothetical protein
MTAVTPEACPACLETEVRAAPNHVRHGYMELQLQGLGAVTRGVTGRGFDG